MALGESLFERAARGEVVERVPVWAMRQAGRWDPAFRELRAGRDFYEFSENPELAARASLCPLRFGVDAIILFYDITTLAIAMGQSFRLEPQRGPVPDRPIRGIDDVRRLAEHPDPEAYRAVLEALRLTRRATPANIPVLVFAGAPFTLATYQVGLGKRIDEVRAFMQDQPAAWNSLLEKTASATIDFLRSLLAEGAAAYQLFDSWAGDLRPDEYERHAQAFHEQIFGEVGGLSILFVKDGPNLSRMAQSGARVISLGTRHDLAEARRLWPGLTFQGNVDHQILVHGDAAKVTAATKACLAAGGGRRHILNLDHGMDRAARPELFEAFVNTATTG